MLVSQMDATQLELITQVNNYANISDELAKLDWAAEAAHVRQHQAAQPETKHTRMSDRTAVLLKRYRELIERIKAKRRPGEPSLGDLAETGQTELEREIDAHLFVLSPQLSPDVPRPNFYLGQPVISLPSGTVVPNLSGTIVERYPDGQFWKYTVQWSTRCQTTVREKDIKLAAPTKEPKQAR